MLDHISLKPRGVISRRALLSILFVPVLMVVGPAAGAHGATKTFGYTGQQQTFVVPAGVSHLQVLAVGAHGAGFGGAGAVVSGTLTVSPGETLYVEVGGAGVFRDPSAAAFNGGGIGGSVPGGGPDGGGGGGASDVRTISMVPLDSSVSLNSRLIVAGAGGGDGTSGTSGGSGGMGGEGGSAGATGANAGSGLTNGGQGAGPSGPGMGGSGNGGGAADGSTGSPGFGGAGGSGNGLAGGGGGGGGGLYGGGGGGGDEGGFGGGGGGGGGSSLVPAAGTSSLAIPGQAAEVQISYQLPPPKPASKPDTKITKAKIRKKKHRAKFSFEAIGSASRFECKLTKAKRKKNPTFWACSSPKTYKKLKRGSYTFEVRARNRQGVDPTPAKRRFTI